ncbi:MAG: flagellar hook protein FlgE [Oscillospiraceae bacterium]
MVRSLYSGVSGLTSHQTKMDVIGNNIANVNTYGFKSSRASFSDVFYQSVKTAAAGTESFAGNNPSTVGYGTQVASIDKDMSQSSFQSTNRTLDLAISGDGFFATGAFSSGADGGAPDITASPDSITYTRNGNFGIDSFGNLVSNNNRFILGTRNSEAGLLKNSDLSAQELLKISLEDNNGDTQINSTDYTFENTINVNDLIADAYGIYTDEDTGYMYTNRKPEAVMKDGKVVGYKQGDIDRADDGTETYYLCDLKGNYVTMEDDNGKALPFFKYVKKDPTDPNSKASFTAAIIDDTGAQQAYTLVNQKKDKDGNDVPYTVDDLAVTGKFTYADLAAFTIGSDGVITTTYNNTLKAIARVEITVFDNPEGLIENGDTSFTETAASGSGKVKQAGEQGAGFIKSNKLEMSNVNLAQEFSDMIVTQRGFQANARIITTSDSMLEELVNLKR